MDQGNGAAWQQEPEVESQVPKSPRGLERDGLDAAIVSGSEYSGFEGAVTYLRLRDRAPLRVCAPAPDGEPSIVFPSEARYVGEHSTTWIEDQVFVDAPGAWLRDRAREQGWSRVGVYGLDYVMTVRDYRALADGGPELVAFEVEFDLARAVKSDEELTSVRDSVRINTEGFRIFLDEFAPGRTEAELLAPCERYFVEQGCGRLTMDMVLVGDDGAAEPEFRIASTERRVREGDLVLPSLEVAGPGGHWVEVSRAIADGEQRRDEAHARDYEESYERAGVMHPGERARTSTALFEGLTSEAKTRTRQGHSIGMTMIEFPRSARGSRPTAGNRYYRSPASISDDGKLALLKDTGS